MGRASQNVDRESEKALALFPGSFKPPHAEHLQGIRYLLGRPDIGTVVIIIANRCRIIPGTTLALGAENSREIMAMFLRFLGFPLGRIRIEIAEHRAVSHALDYFSSGQIDRKLLFCVGAEDYQSSDDRYAELQTLSRNSGIPASIVVLPRGQKNIRATRLRESLAEGAEHRNAFFNALPDRLSKAEQRDLWVACRSMLRPVEQLVRSKLYNYLANLGAEPQLGLEVVNAETVDPMFRLRRSNDSDLIIKYAGDTVGNGSFAGPKSQKPAGRLAVEKRALKHVSQTLFVSFSVPTVVGFDRDRRILMLTDVIDGANPLSESFRSGPVALEAFHLAGSFLGRLHSMDVPGSPFWGDWQIERDHWNRLLQQLEDSANQVLLSHGYPEVCQNHGELSDDSIGQNVLHLSFSAENIAFIPRKLVVTNFERCSSFGDPAFDLSTLVCDYLSYSDPNVLADAASGVLRTFFSSYQESAGIVHSGFLQRVFRYAAMHMLTDPNEHEKVAFSGVLPARKLLAVGILQLIADRACVRNSRLSYPGANCIGEKQQSALLMDIGALMQWDSEIETATKAEFDSEL